MSFTIMHFKQSIKNRYVRKTVLLELGKICGLRKSDLLVTVPG